MVDVRVSIGPAPARRGSWRGSWRSGCFVVTTAAVVAECVVGGAMDLARAAPFYPAMLELGYPPYLETIIGTAKLAAAAVIAAPGLPRLKEWAYAGVTIDLVGAGASCIGVHGSPTQLIAPAALTVVVLVSWATRPPGRRLREPVRGDL